MAKIEIWIRTVRMAILASLLAWAIAAGAMEYIAPAASESAAAYPLAPINE